MLNGPKNEHPELGKYPPQPGRPPEVVRVAELGPKWGMLPRPRREKRGVTKPAAKLRNRDPRRR